LAAPAISVNYLTDRGGADMATLKAGLRLARKMAAGPAFAK
jgi:hypothetical protein